MGLLISGRTLDWPSAKKAAQQVRDDGIEQLVSLWQRTKDRDNDPFLWGDETEGLLLVFENESRQVQPYPYAANLIKELNTDREYLEHGELMHCAADFQPEASSFSLESVPEKPRGVSSHDLLVAEANMKSRRALIKKHMKVDGCFVTLTLFPRLGAKEDSPCDDALVPSDEIQRSQFLRDNLIGSHVRYKTMTANIRWRRGRKVEVNVPVYRDTKTPWPFHDPTVDYDLHRWPEDDDVRNGAVKENHIHMDSSLFGFSCCGLQITVQTRNMDEARKLYDQLLPMGPILLALTAATPVVKGFLADTDVRWNMVAASVDDRTREECGDKPLCNDRWRLPKPRWASGSTYISQDPRLRDEYLDQALIVDEAIKQRLRDAGMDQRLAAHFAHLAIRDPLIVYDEDLEKVEIKETRRFEMIQTTNWQTLRFKPPPSFAEETGWRVEVRSMEVQITDFENAAFSIFVVLLTRTILHFDLNLYIPIGKIDENMEKAHARDAVVSRHFFFRSKITPETVDPENPNGGPYTNGGTSQDPPSRKNSGAVADEYRPMSINEIINGGSSSSPREKSPGLIPLIEKYLDTCDYDSTTRSRLDEYLNFIKERANGNLSTTAKWLRSFIQEHPEYNSDSVVGKGVLYDLIKLVREMSETDFNHGLKQKLLDSAKQVCDFGIAKD